MADHHGIIGNMSMGGIFPIRLPTITVKGEYKSMTIGDLIEFGADTRGGLKRCLNNEDFYLRMVKKMSGDANFQKLYDAMKAGDQDAAFAAVHALKGALGNLALTPIFAPASELTELLRVHTRQDCTALLETIRRGQEALIKICAE